MTREKSSWLADFVSALKNGVSAYGFMYLQQCATQPSLGVSCGHLPALDREWLVLLKHQICIVVYCSAREWACGPHVAQGLHSELGSFLCTKKTRSASGTHELGLRRIGRDGGTVLSAGIKRPYLQSVVEKDKHGDLLRLFAVLELHLRGDCDLVGKAVPIVI